MEIAPAFVLPGCLRLYSAPRAPTAPSQCANLVDSRGKCGSCARSVAAAGSALVTVVLGIGGVVVSRMAAHNGRATHCLNGLPEQLDSALSSTCRCTLAGYARQSRVLEPVTHPL